MAGGRLTGNFAENRPVDKPGSAGIIAVKYSARQFTGGKQAGDRPVVGALNGGIGVDAQTAEGKGDAAGNGIGLIRRGRRAGWPSYFWANRGLWYRGYP